MAGGRKDEAMEICIDSWWRELIPNVLLAIGIFWGIKKLREYGEMEDPITEYDNYDFRHRYNDQTEQEEGC